MFVSRCVAAFTLALFLIVPAAPAQTAPPEWVQRSNENAKILTEVLARFSPETASQFGIDGHDRDVTVLPLDFNARTIAAQQEALKELEAKLAAETDPAIRQDLQILINSVNNAIEGIRLGEKYQLPYFNVSQLVFLSLSSLLDERVPAERRVHALVRLRKYTGTEKGTTPLTEQAIAFTRARLRDPSLIGPFKDNVEKDLGDSGRYLAGIESLFKKFAIKGYEKPYGQLKRQFEAYDAFVRTEVLPRATTDFRLPEELYRYQLKAFGVDMPVEELISRAKTSFREIQNEMQSVAALVAKEKGYPSNDYRDLIRELKKQQLGGDAIVPHYQKRIKDLEKLVREQNVVSLPAREMQMRLASEAETAAIPAPHLNPPRLVGNTGEQAIFVLPLRMPGSGGKEMDMDDFTFDAASWTLSVHEGRPGHELQFASMMEKGVSTARVLFAFNSVNIEGWALYAEAEMKPYEPMDGQLIALQQRLLRAARAFIDPSLQLGRMTRDEAFRVLEDDVVLSKGMALQEVERYTFRAPGQATSYFVGYVRLMELRTDAERMLGKHFDRRSYHDFILAQGLLSPALLRQAVMNEYVKGVRSKHST
jgi:uncharacterized protein (DUF885 family)